MRSGVKIVWRVLCKKIQGVYRASLSASCVCFLEFPGNLEKKKTQR